MPRPAVQRDSQGVRLKESEQDPLFCQDESGGSNRGWRREFISIQRLSGNSHQRVIYSHSLACREKREQKSHMIGALKEPASWSHAADMIHKPQQALPRIMPFQRTLIRSLLRDAYCIMEWVKWHLWREKGGDLGAPDGL